MVTFPSDCLQSFHSVPGGELPQDAGCWIGSPEATIRPDFYSANGGVREMQGKAIRLVACDPAILVEPINREVPDKRDDQPEICMLCKSELQPGAATIVEVGPPGDTLRFVFCNDCASGGRPAAALIWGAMDTSRTHKGRRHKNVWFGRSLSSAPSRYCYPSFVGGRGARAAKDRPRELESSDFRGLHHFANVGDRAARRERNWYGHRG